MEMIYSGTFRILRAQYREVRRVRDGRTIKQIEIESLNADMNDPDRKWSRKTITMSLKEFKRIYNLIPQEALSALEEEPPKEEEAHGREDGGTT